MVVLISFNICLIGWIKSGDLSLALGAFYLYIDFLINVNVLRIDEPIWDTDGVLVDDWYTDDDVAFVEGYSDWLMIDYLSY